MTDNQRVPTLQQQTNIQWNKYNYPPLLKLFRFLPSELPKRKKFIVTSLFTIHIVILINSILNFVDCCAQGGLRVLYGLLFLIFINPLIMFIFQRGYLGICQDRDKLKLFLIAQPIAIVFEITISIVNLFGINGFMRANDLIKEQKRFAGGLAVLVSMNFLGIGLYSALIYVRILREKENLTSDI